VRRHLLIALIAVILTGGTLLIPQVRSEVRSVIRREPPPQITPLAVSLPSRTVEDPLRVPSATVEAQTAAPPSPTATASVAPSPSATPEENASDVGTPRVLPSSPTLEPTIAPTATATTTRYPVVVHGRIYDAYIPAATKEGQAYQYSCEFDAAWAILQTYGVDASVDELVGIVGVDDTIEPYIEETPDAFIIHGGDITTAFSGDYRSNFLARSSGTAIRKAFEHYGLETTPVSDRDGLETALLRGELVWIKTTVDFKPWRPAIWRMPDGRTHQTVLGNDHAVVVMGFNAESVVIRDVLGPTSTNRQRPYEYEVGWDTFMAAWGAQSFDGLAVAPRPPS
jgi:hypothetical protein